MMYDLVVLGNPLVRLSAGSTQGPAIVGPSITTASVAARLGVEGTVIVGAISTEWRTQAVSNLDLYSIPEHVLLQADRLCSAALPTPSGSTIELAIAPTRIRIRDIPAEFLSTRMVVLSPFAGEVDDELIEWFSSSSNATLIWDPSFYRVTNGRAIHTVMERSEARRILRLVDVVALHQSECQYLIGEDDPLVAAELIVELGAGAAIVTQGDHGSTVYEGDDFLVVPAYPTGTKGRCWAGAAFVAGIASALLAEQPLIKAVALASSVASVFVEQKDRYAPLDMKTIDKRQRHIMSRIEFR